MYANLQNERSFQKQPTVFLNRKKGVNVKKGRKSTRYHRDVGLGFKTPREVCGSAELFVCAWCVNVVFISACRQKKLSRSSRPSTSTAKAD